MTDTDALARALYRFDLGAQTDSEERVLTNLARLGYEVRPICTTCTALHSVRSASGMPIHQAAEAADRLNLPSAGEARATPFSSAAAAPLDVEALAAALQALCDGPRRIQIVENDVEGMGSLVWPNEYADLLAAAYAAAKEAGA